MGFEEPFVGLMFSSMKPGFLRLSEFSIYVYVHGSSRWAMLWYCLENTLKYRGIPEFKYGERSCMTWNAYLRRDTGVQGEVCPMT